MSHGGLFYLLSWSFDKIEPKFVKQRKYRAIIKPNRQMLARALWINGKELSKPMGHLTVLMSNWKSDANIKLYSVAGM